jgi:hypothetical protein
VEPLVRESWNAESSLVCDRNAEEIARILGIGELDIPEWLRELLDKLEAVEGDRRTGDNAEQAAPSGPTPAIDEDQEDEPFDGEPVPYEHALGVEGHEVVPKPYLALMEQAMPYARRLIEELRIEGEGLSIEPSKRGGRLSMRQQVRDRDRPFLVEQEDGRGIATMTFRLVIDHSTSMMYQDRIVYAAQSAMMLHLAAVELEIPHEIVVTPDDIRIASLGSGEMGLAMIAGIDPALTGYEDTGLAVSVHGSELSARSEDVKLLLVVHDGMGNDYELLQNECRRLRDKVLILGLGIGMGETEAGLLRKQFGPDRYIHCALPEELPAKLGAVLRAVQGV